MGNTFGSYRVGLCVCLMIAGGCNGGPTVSPVVGKVTMGGSTLAGATVTFSPVKGGTGSAAVGTVDPSGAYKLTDMKSTNIGSGAVVGDYHVGVVWFKPETNDSSRSSGASNAGAMTSDKASATTASGPKLAVPTAYQNPETSGLKASVKAGENTFDFTLDPKFKGSK